MAGTVVKVWLEGAWAPEGKPLPFHNVETSFPDFEAFLIAMAEDALICGDRLRTCWGDDRGVRVITERSVIAFRGSAVRVAELPDCRFVEAGD